MRHIFKETQVVYERKKKNYHTGKGCSLFLINLTIRTIVWYLPISPPCLLSSKHMGLRRMRNVVYCVGSTLIRKKRKENWLRKLLHWPREAVAENITWQAPKIKTQRANQQPTMVAEVEAEVVMRKEAVIKGGADEQGVSSKRWTRLQYVTLRAKWNNLEHF